MVVCCLAGAQGILRVELRQLRCVARDGTGLTQDLSEETLSNASVLRLYERETIHSKSET